MASGPESSHAWYVVHTFSGFENRVKETLRQRVEALGLQDSFHEIVVPTEAVTEIREDKRVDTRPKFFPGYILVKMAMSDAAWAAVKNTPKVTGFIGTGKKPTPLTQEEAQTILTPLNPRGGPPPQAVRYEIGEPVGIVDGPFAGFAGKVEQVDEQRGLLRVVVSIHGRPTSMELKHSAVEKAG